MRYPITRPYRKLKKFVSKGGKLSLRKQMCFQFLRWCYTTREEDKDKFIDLLRLWRKEERRVGRSRTLLERKGRKLFQENINTRKRRASADSHRKSGELARDLGTGVHSPEQKAKHKENTDKGRETQRVTKGGNRMDWLVHSPDGQTFRVRGLTDISRENGLDRRHLDRTARKGKGNRRHKGWWAEKINVEFENL